MWMHQNAIHVKRRPPMEWIIPNFYNRGKLDDRLAKSLFHRVLLASPGPWSNPHTYPCGDTVVRMDPKKVQKELSSLYENMKCVTCKDIKMQNFNLKVWYFD